MILPRGLLATAALGELNYGPVIFDTSAAGCCRRPLTPNCLGDPCSQVDNGEEDDPNFRTLPQASWLSSEATGTLRLALLFFFAKNSTRA